MPILITKGQAACILLGEIVTNENRVKCKAIMKETPFEIVHTSESGNRRPIAIAKNIFQRNPFDYLEYPDTPPNVSFTSPLNQSRSYSPVPHVSFNLPITENNVCKATTHASPILPAVESNVSNDTALEIKSLACNDRGSENEWAGYPYKGPETDSNRVSEEKVWTHYPYPGAETDSGKEELRDGYSYPGPETDSNRVSEEDEWTQYPDPASTRGSWAERSSDRSTI